MSKRKLTKKELLEKKVIEDRKFNRTLLISFGSFFILAIFFNIFIVFRYDTKFVYRKYTYSGAYPPTNSGRIRSA